MIRRNFLKTGSIGVASNFVLSKKPFKLGAFEDIKIRLNFTSDGLGLSPKKYAQLLVQLIEKKDITPDVYGLGGFIHNFENKVAASLGKERAIYMPTGTLANHIACRLHSPRRKKVLVQQQSHIYRDCGGALPQLSGLQLIPLAESQVTFRLDDVKKAVLDASIEKVDADIDAISIETPVRRHQLRRFDYDAMKDISTYARDNNIGMHLDGARIYGEAAMTGIKVKEYANLFDTVYISLYKYFNSIGGAILAGPASLIDGLHHERRMFGGGLRSVWENVIVADYFFDGFVERFQQAQKIGIEFLDKIGASKSIKVQSFKDGTNIYRICLEKGDPTSFRNKIIEAGIDFPNYRKNEKCFLIKLNESLLGVDADEIAALFLKIAG